MIRPTEAVIVADIRKHGPSTLKDIVERHPEWDPSILPFTLGRMSYKGKIQKADDGTWWTGLKAGQQRLKPPSAKHPWIVVETVSGAGVRAGFRIVAPKDLAENVGDRVLPSKESVMWEATHLWGVGRPNKKEALP